MNSDAAVNPPRSRRGGPLAMLGVLFAVWIMGRVVLWESPFPIEPMDLPGAELLLAESSASHNVPDQRQAVDEGAELVALPAYGIASDAPLTLPVQPGRIASGWQLAPFSNQAAPRASDNAFIPSDRPMNSTVAGGHQLLMAAAFRVDWAVEAAMAPVPGSRSSGLAYAPSRRASVDAAPLPFSPPFVEGGPELDRWSLDMFAYYRQGSNSSLISQGRAPLYGASQVSANLQYRIAPRSGHDPRAYLRAYRALVTGGESEIAAGFSARPVPAIPVRLAAEMRVTDNVFGVVRRPAAYAVTEIAPVVLPLDFRIEAYGSAGYVGGRGATPFADGQVALTRELVRFNGPGAQPIRFSLGGGAWGGAQEDASRVDVGPTMRVDLSVGQVPARLSVDWREQVAGDAAPASGVAATLSTRF
ncbi:hypothetical protein [uncultured Erythrobacter sp.]|uniref:hypothetical protein n=1 Tax=uncultured Erythrobacter sp. TaxID=263913 RepID=UPI00261C8198|nr:hypothetical protein [uncultured Erythrobacter sp.]